MSRFVPTLTPEQYRQRSLGLRVEVVEIAWSLVVSPQPASEPRRWKTLPPAATLDVFDRLMAAATRHASTDRARIDGPLSVPRR